MFILLLKHNMDVSSENPAYKFIVYFLNTFFQLTCQSAADMIMYLRAA
jgi:hypothetical protein